MKQLLTLAPIALLAACAAVPPAGLPPTTDSYRAVGTEPFWGLTITEHQMIFDNPNGPTQIVEPTPRPTIGVAGEMYRTPRLNVNVVHAQCSDGMSDRVYPDRVQVTADGRRFEGCGGAAVAPVILSATSWTVTAVNGHTTPSSPEYYINFDADRLTAKFGCNRFTANYDLAGDVLRAGPLAGTRMACPEMSFESQASAILSGPVRMNYHPDDRVTLSNSTGSIDMRRSF